jgi:predicted methyltransferase
MDLIFIGFFLARLKLKVTLLFSEFVTSNELKISKPTSNFSQHIATLICYFAAYHVLHVVNIENDEDLFNHH